MPTLSDTISALRREIARVEVMTRHDLYSQQVSDAFIAAANPEAITLILDALEEAQRKVAPKPLLILSTGEYSDYDWSGPYRPVRTFTMREAIAAFREQWKPTNSWQTAANPSELVDWLLSAGWIEAIDSTEIHVGEYGEIKVGCDAIDRPLSADLPLDAALRECGEEQSNNVKE